MNTVAEVTQQNGEAIAAVRLDSRWNLIWMCAGLSVLPMLVPYFLGMWRLEHYQYFPFAIILVCLLTYFRSFRPFSGPHSTATWMLVILGMTATIASVLIGTSWLSAIGAVILSTAFLSCQSGPRDRSLLGLAVPLYMLIRLPVGLDQMLVVQLQRITTRLASVVLDFLAVPHVTQGNILQLTDRELFVAEACSGVQSVFTLAFLSTAIIAIFRRPIWFTPIYLVIAVILAIIGNVVRVTTIAAAIYLFNVDLTSGVAHDSIGYVALIISAVFLLSFDHLAITVLHPSALSDGHENGNPILAIWDFLLVGPTDEEYARRHGRSSAIESFLNRLFISVFKWRVSAVVAGSLLFIFVMAASIQASRVNIETPMASLLKSFVLFKPEENLLKGKVGSLVYIDHEASRNGSHPRLGQNSDVWSFRAVDLDSQGQFVLSQTYSGWHELCVCYEGIEWQLVDRDTILPTKIWADDSELGGLKNTNNESFITAKFKRTDGKFGYLMFGAVFEDGTICEAPSSLGAFGARFLSRLDLYGVVDQRDLVMVQLWIVQPEKTGVKELRGLQQGFVLSRDKIAEAMRRENGRRLVPANLTSDAIIP